MGMRNPVSRILIVGAVLALASALVWTPSARATDVTYNLYGDNNSGFGLTPQSLSTPGPSLTANVGDNVTLILASTDNNQYRWFLDYNNDSVRDTNEPRSSTFRGTPVQWNFTPDTPGTFHYRTQSDPSVMWGMFTITNVTSPPSGTPLSNTTAILITVGLVVAFVAVLAVGAILARRKKEKRA